MTAGMGRIRSDIQLDGAALWALFDTGARNSYISRDRAAPLMPRPLRAPRTVRLGGSVRSLTEVCMVEGTLDGRRLEFEAYVVDDLGADEAGKRIDLIFGALAMQKWGVRPVPDEETLDLSHFAEEFTEY